MKSFRIICRTLHRDLSFFFSGVIMIYAISGLTLNHKRDFNAEYDISVKKYQVEGTYPKSKADFTKDYVKELLSKWDEQDNYTKHYFPSTNQMKVFIKGGGTLLVNTDTGQAIYECVKKRPFFASINRLHYNPNRNWTIFSDIFIISLIIITITGLIMVKGRKGLWGIGGIEFILGILIPLCFIFF